MVKDIYSSRSSICCAATELNISPQYPLQATYIVLHVLHVINLAPLYEDTWIDRHEKFSLQLIFSLYLQRSGDELQEETIFSESELRLRPL